ncbi:MAG: DUF2760 domain-containing protein [Pseudobacteriovorax sp.]|nr:DUF2760 domain-containing protein [Pseudobacteriovorax sp.]
MILIVSLIGIVLTILASRTDIQIIPESSHDIAMIGLWTLMMTLGIRQFFLAKKAVGIQKHLENQTIRHAQEQGLLAKKTKEIENEKADIKLQMESLSEELATQKRNFEQLYRNHQIQKDKTKKVELELEQAKSNNPESSVLSMLSSLQKHGRFVDFVMGDISKYPDDKVGAASRVVHQGCREILQQYFDFKPIAETREGSDITVSNPSELIQYKLIGESNSTLPKTGKLVHKGWQTTKVNLPKQIGPQDNELKIISPAEVKL